MDEGKTTVKDIAKLVYAVMRALCIVVATFVWLVYEEIRDKAKEVIKKWKSLKKN